MERIVSPPLQELSQLRQPLTPGENTVLQFLLVYLPEAWEIYIQPHMNGLCPDFVLLHPQRGIQIIEVKDWDLGSMPSRWDQTSERHPSLWRQNPQGKWFRVKDEPIAKLKLYTDELMNLYCPRLGVNLAGHFKGASPVIASCLAIPNASEERIRSFFSGAFYNGNINPTYCPMIGAGVLASGDIASAVPFTRQGVYRLMQEQYAADLRHWLVEPQLRAEQRMPLPLDSRQKDIAETRTRTGYRRVRGAAGSGKSQVLAAKAAILSSQEKSVLVVTFNITLGNYLRDMIQRGGLLYPQSKVLSRVTILNFHAWAKRVCIGSGNADRYYALWRGGKQNALNDALATLAQTILDEQGEAAYRYDAVLVDEGQDFRLSWWNTLRAATRKDGEMLLVADHTQDLYETAAAWTDEAMLGAGFRGNWVALDVSYRLPSPYIPYISDYAERFMPEALRSIPQHKQQSLDIEPVLMYWTQTTGCSSSLCADVISGIVTSADDTDIADILAFSDICFMASTNESGMKVVQLLDAQGIKVVQTFDKDTEKARRQKMAFYLGSEKVKATTIHSFKGWESRLVVIQIEPISGSDQSHVAAVYAALTRLKAVEGGASCIAVICSDPAFRNYGTTWPNYREVEESLRFAV